MSPNTILLLHGFASSGRSTKAQYFGERCKALPQVTFHAFEFNPTPTDFEYLTITGMINRLRQYLLDQQRGNVGIIASSMGALVGLHFAHRFGGVDAMLLLAPALLYGPVVDDKQLERWKEEGTVQVPHYHFEQEVPLRYDFHIDGLGFRDPIPPPTPITIIHGRNDDVIPIDHSRGYAANFPERVKLIEVDSDHRLNDQLAFIWRQVRSFLLD
jgi:pimeloyl-ACP methyl ester carboxylesterase